jgi:plastocyanin
LAAAGLLLTVVASGAAQDASPTATEAAHAHPAHIHLGSCDQLDPNPTFMLTDIAPAQGDADNAAAIPVERSATTVDATLDELQSGGYAINVHQSVEDIGTYIACGNLGGAIDNGALIVGLGELNGSGHTGVAILTEQGEQTDVTVYLVEGSASEAASTDAASDDAAAASADAVAVDIKDFTYVPDPIEVPAGTTITWTNSDAVPHTATAQDRAVLQSGTLNQGDSFSQTFAEPGSYDYFCEFHANMKGTIVVQ